MKTIPKYCTVIVPNNPDNDTIGKIFTGMESIESKIFFVLEENKLPYKDIVGWATQSKTIVLINSDKLKPFEVLCLGYHCQIAGTKLRLLTV